MSDDKDELVAQAQEKLDIYRRCFIHHFRDANYDDRLKTIKFNDLIDCKFGFERYTEVNERIAWLVNIQPVRYGHYFDTLFLSMSISIVFSQK